MIDDMEEEIDDEDEDEEEGGRQNRLFVILAVALIGLLVLGLLGIGGVFIIRQNVQEQAAVQFTPTLMIRLPNPSPTFTPMAPLATHTPQPTPTNTPVVAPGSVNGQEAAAGKDNANANGDQQVSQQGSPTAKLVLPGANRTPVPGAAPAGKAVVPETGVGGLETALIAAGLVAVLFVARRLRTSL